MPRSRSPLDCMREICLALPNASEGKHFEDVIFRVKRRIFASCGEKTGEGRIVVQLDPEHAARLLAEDPRFTAYTRQKNCVSLAADQVREWEEVRELVLESYRLNAR